MCVWIILHSQVSHRNHENIKRNICIYKSQCEFWSSYRGDVSTRGFLGCDVGPTFQRSLLPPCSAWRWRQHGPLSRWYPTTALHGVTTQKTRLEASVYTHTHTHTHTHLFDTLSSGWESLNSQEIEAKRQKTKCRNGKTTKYSHKSCAWIKILLQQLMVSWRWTNKHF